MSDANREVFCSNIFTFNVGTSGKRFYAHQEAVSRFSEPLKAMMTSGLKESCEGRACLDQVDEDTFSRFLEFVYSGSYNAAKHEEENHELGDFEEIDRAKQRSNESPEELDHVFECIQPEQEATEPSMDTTRLLAPIMFDVPKVDPLPSTPASINNKENPYWNFAKTLLSHAQLFDFAEVYLVQDLRETTTQNLSTALETFTLHWCRVPDVVNLVKHIYDISPEPREAQHDVPTLRQVVTRFVANNVDILVTSETFRDLLVDGGLFTRDLVVSMVERT